MADLIDRYITIILPTKPKDARNMKRYLDWWRDKIGKYGLTRISPDLIAQCRQELTEGVTSKKTIRSHSTVNRYLVTLSTVFTYGIKECKNSRNEHLLPVVDLAITTTIHTIACVFHPIYSLTLSL